MSARVTGLHEGSSGANATPLPDLHDRITEAYYGKIGEEFARSTRERVHWICAHVEGERVLDVGCSQGIVAILLGREAKRVVGIDAMRRSIDQARDYLAQEPMRAEEYVAFVHGDFLTYDFGAELFDTIIMTEVLEHLTHPRAFVVAAAERLKENGRVIVTVPFGVNDWPDHKQTFYLAEPWRLISTRFAIDDVKVFGRWIGFIGRKRSAQAKEGDLPQLAVLTDTEAAFQKIERELLGRANALLRQVSDVQAKLHVADQQKTVLQTKVVESEAACRNAEQSLAQLRQGQEEALEVVHTKLEAAESRFTGEKNRFEQESIRLAAELKASEKLAERFWGEAEKAAGIADRERTARFEMEKKLLLSERLAEDLSARLQASQSLLSERADEISAAATAAESVLKKLKAARAAQQAAEGKVHQLQRQLRDAISERARLQSRADLFQQQKLNAAAQAERIKETVAFRLGRALIFGSKSWRALQALPSELLAIRQEALRRRAIKEVKVVPVSAASRAPLALPIGSTLAPTPPPNLTELAVISPARPKEVKVAPSAASRAPLALPTGSTLAPTPPPNLTELAVISPARPKEVKLAPSAASRAPLALPTGPTLAPTPPPNLPELEVILPARSKEVPARPKEVKVAPVSAASRAPLALPTGSTLAPTPPPNLTELALMPPVRGPANVDQANLLFGIVCELAKTLPTSDGSRLQDKIPIRVGIITDRYMYNFYKDAFDGVHYLSPDNYEDVFSSEHLDVILYVTCWRGLENDEWRGINEREKPAKALDAILEKGRARGAKPIFQSIEDPSNYEHFLPLAKKFDYILTSDVDSIDHYKAECGHKRVFYGEYGANPRLNNPIGCRRHVINAAFFAGSWTARYQERCEDMQTILDSIQSSGGQLLIADRNYGKNVRDLRYPERFRGSIIPAIEHELLQAVHKLFRYNLNFNSIKNSPTMCAMRVYEMQAMGVGFLSNYARSVFNKFPEIRIVPYQEDLSAEFEPTSGFEEYRQNMALVRNILNDKTAYDVGVRMATVVGFEGITVEQPMICVICDGNNAAAHANFERQRYEARILVKVSDVDTESKWAAVASEHRIAFFTWFTDEDEYEENYLDDLVNAFKYTAARYVTRAAWFDAATFHDGVQHDYTQRMGGKARTLFAAEEFSPLQFMDRAPHEAVAELFGGYAVDPFELNYRRYLERENAQAETSQPRLSVVVPVFNNGRFLRAKCIQSLKRNRLWSQMEVLLVDDGSTDLETLQILENLAREHANIRTFSFRDGGSGSASRARNKGIDLATAPLVSFLDPDNEISSGGYDTLHSLYEEAATLRVGGADFVAGFHLKVAEQTEAIGKHTSNRLQLIECLKERFLESGRFPVVPTQPAILSRRMFEDGALRFVERSSGQDTLFGWELLCRAEVGAFTDAAYIIYYAQRAGSIVNAIDAAYFEKQRILEAAQVAMLTRHHLLAAYLKHRYDYFMNSWYLPKLTMVKDEGEQVRCATILAEIAGMYGKVLSYTAFKEAGILLSGIRAQMHQGL